jgi:hypothetical protein
MTISAQCTWLLGCLVEGGADDLALAVALEVGDLLRALIHEQDDELHVGRVLRDGVRHVLHEDGLAGARRGDNQAALAEADRRDDVHHAHGDILLPRHLEQDALERVIRDEFLERRDLGDFRRLAAHDGADGDHGRTTVAGLRRLQLHLDRVAALEAEMLHKYLGQEGVLGIKAVIHVVMHDEPQAAVGLVEIAAVIERDFLLGDGREDLRDELAAVRRAFEFHLELLRKGRELGQIEGEKLVQPDRVGLARGNLVGELRDGLKTLKAGRIRQVAVVDDLLWRRRLRRMLRCRLEILVAPPFAATAPAEFAALTAAPFATATAAIAVLLVLASVAATIAALGLTAVVLGRRLALVVALRSRRLGLRGRRWRSLAHGLGSRGRRGRRCFGEIELLGRDLRGLLAAPDQTGARGLLGFGRGFAGSFVFVGFRRD